MPYSVIIDDEVHDIKYIRQRHVDFVVYVVTLNRKPICQIFKMNDREFSVVVIPDLKEGVPRTVDGFASRWRAMEYALKVLSYH